MDVLEKRFKVLFLLLLRLKEESGGVSEKYLDELEKMANSGLNETLLSFAEDQIISLLEK